MGDRELIRAIKQGDGDSARELVDKYYPLILRYCAAHYRQQGEDLAQETFLRVFRELPRFDESGSFKAWIYTIAYHLCVDQSRRPPELPLDEELPAPGRELDQAEDRARLHALLAPLPSRLRESLILRYCAQLSYKDIGRLMGVPPKTAQSRVRLALRALRKEKP